MKRNIRKILIITAITIISVIALMIVLPLMFPEAVSDQMKTITNETLKSEINFKDADLSFFKHFPNLTFTLYDYAFKGSKPFENDTLIGGKELSFGINLASVFSETIEINKLFFHQSFFNILTDKAGKTNYDIFSGNDEISTGSETATETHMSIEGFTITESRLHYSDSSLLMAFSINNLEYFGKGKLDNNLFRLESGIFAEGVDFTYDGTGYLKNKQLKAMMVTEINLEPLEITFTNNELLINKLPINFVGSTKFPDNGIDLDFSIVSGETDFGNFFTIMPPEYDTWFKNMHFDGTSKLIIGLKGLYTDSLAPDLTIKLNVKNGKIKHNLAPTPIENLQVNASINIDNLNFNSTKLRIDTLNFKLGDETSTFRFNSKGIDTPYLNSNINTKMDLGLLTKALGFSTTTMTGNLNLTANLDGTFDSVRALIPKIESRVYLANGSIQTSLYPQPIEQIEINARIDCKTGKMNDLKFEILPFSFLFEQQPFSIQTKLEDFEDLHYDIIAKGTLNLRNIYQVFAIENYSITGLLLADLDLHGRQSDAEKGDFNKLNNAGTLGLSDVELHSADYPFPFIIPKATIRVENDKAWLKNSQLNYRDNTFNLDGYMQNFIGYSLLNNELRGNLLIKCPKLNVEDFMLITDSVNIDTISTTDVIQLPDNLNLTLDADFKAVDYMQTRIDNFVGQVKLQKSKLSILNTRFNIAGAAVSINASYLPVSSKRALFDFGVKADSFDIKRAYNEIPLFREMATAAAEAEGLISIDYTLKGKLNEKMEAIYPNISGKGFVKLENIQVKSYKLFSAVGRVVGRDSINNPNLKAVTIRSSIANNIITIEKTKMKVFGFRPHISGQTSLDGKLNLHIRLGLPPLGIIGIPMTVTGTADNPIVKIRKEREGDKLEDIEDKDDTMNE